MRKILVFLIFTFGIILSSDVNMVKAVAAPRQPAQLPSQHATQLSVASPPAVASLYKPNEVVVKWKENLRGKTATVKLQTAFKQVAGRQLNAATVKIVRDNPKRNLAVITASDFSTAELIEQFQNLPAVEYAHENLIFHTQAQSTPWGVDNSEGVKGRQANSEGYTGNGVVIAVIDTGADLDHEDLSANLWTPSNGNCVINGTLTAGGCPYSGYDFANNDNDPSDDNGHGTHVAGIIAAADNTIGVVGVAPQATLMIIKVLDADGAGDYTTIIQGIDFAIDNGADIINMSLGAMNAGVVLKDMQDALAEAETNGITVVIAAGNSSSPVPFVPSFFENVLAVGAVQQTATQANPVDNYNTRLAFFSNFGKINVVAPGVRIVSTTNDGLYSDESWQGTSMAAPHVAGVVALLKEKNPLLTPAQIRYILETTAADLGAAGKDEFFGSGLVDADAALDKTGSSSTKTILLEGNWSKNNATVYNTVYYLEPSIYSTLLPADGSATTAFRVRVATADGTVVANEAVTLSTTAGTITSSTSTTTDSSGLAEFTLQAPSTAGIATITATLTATGATDSITITFADTLLITDAGQPIDPGNEGWFYARALDADGVFWKPSVTAYPADDTTLAAYDQVVWHTERYYLDATEQDNIKTYLDQGGKIFISGGDILYAYYYYATYGGQPTIAVDTIFTNYLKVGYSKYIASDFTLVGDGYFDTLGAEINDYLSANDNFGFSDVITAASGGTVQGYFCSNTENALVTVDSTYKSVFLSVALEEVSKTSREEIMANALDFLAGAAPAGGSYALPSECDSSIILNDGTVDDPTTSADDDNLPVPALPDETTLIGIPIFNNLAVTERTDTAVSLSWETAEDISSTIIYAKNYETDATEATAAAGTTSGTITGLTPNTTYIFSVYGVYADGSLSAASTVSTITLPGAPGKPTVAAKTHNSLVVGLTDPYDSGYQFIVELHNKKKQLLSTTTLAQGKSVAEFTGLTADRKYYVRAKVGYIELETDEEIYSDFSSYLGVKTYDDQTGKPRIVKQQAGQVKIKWRKPAASHIAKYIIQIWQKYQDQYRYVSKINVRTKLKKSTKKHWIKNLLSGQNYRVRATAKFKDNTLGTWSKYQKFKTKF